MKILFIGSVHFSANALQALIEMRSEIVGVCTVEKSELNSDHQDLAGIAGKAKIPVKYTEDVNSDESVCWIRNRKPDVIFCFGWSRLIRPPLLHLPPLGVVGFHPTALPENRGRHPLIWSLVLGLEETASSFFFMKEGPDTGDLISQEKLPIFKTDDASSLYNRVTGVAIRQIQEFVPLLASGKVNRIPQDERYANTWRKRSVDDGRIDWRISAECIQNLVRGLTRPYPGAHFCYKSQHVKVWKADIVLEVSENLEPGKVLAIDESSVLVKAGKGAIRLLQFEPEISVNVGDYL